MMTSLSTLPGASARVYAPSRKEQVMAIWMENSNAVGVGRVGFLVRREYRRRGLRVEYSLQFAPAWTGSARKCLLYGMCRDVDDIAVYAEGLGRVARVAANGRMQVVQLLAKRAIRDALYALGYPELASSV